MYRFPDATDDELQRADNTCIVCREDMAAGGRNKKLPCNHVFHLHCLRYALVRVLQSHYTSGMSHLLSLSPRIYPVSMVNRQLVTA